MRQDSRLSSVVPHNTAFLPPAFMAILPPMVEASCDVGSTANASPRAAASSETRRVTTPDSTRIVLICRGGNTSPAGKSVVCTGSLASSFSRLITAVRACNGIAPPVYPVPPPLGTMVSCNSIQVLIKSGSSTSLSFTVFLQ